MNERNQNKDTALLKQRTSSDAQSPDKKGGALGYLSSPKAARHCIFSIFFSTYDLYWEETKRIRVKNKSKTKNFKNLYI